MSHGSINIVPLASFPDGNLLQPLARVLQATFHAKTRVTPVDLDFARAYDADRDQYNSSTLLVELLSCRPPGCDTALAVVDFDLFVPILTFLFGEAQHDGAVGIVSTCRLRDEFYGLDPSPHLLQERFLKESVHEVGHIRGLGHCSTHRCVMNTSATVDEIDEKSVLFCRRCREVLAGGLRPPRGRPAGP